MDFEFDGKIQLDVSNSFDDLGECVIITSPERRILYVNAAMAKLLGYSADQMIGNTTRGYFKNPKDFEKLSEIYNSEKANRFRKSYAVNLRRADGSSIPVEVFSAPLMNSEGQISGILFITRDVSERERLKSQLSDIATTLEESIDAISEGFALYDKDDRLVICNENYRAIYRKSADAMYPGSRFEDILRRGLQNKQYDTKGQSDEEWLTERIKNHLAADGSVVEQSLADGRWLRISERRTSSGGIAGIRADITPIKKAEAEAAAAFRNLTMIANSIDSAIAEVDDTGTCVFINATGAAWFDSDPEDLIGIRLRDRFPWSQGQQLKKHHDAAINGERISAEMLLHFPDGVPRECQIDISPKIETDEKVSGLVILATDITNRKRTDRTLAELYSITSTQELAHDEKVQQILELGCEHFSLPFGIISHVIDEHYTVIHAASPNGELSPGMSFDLKDTYCAVTLKADAPVGTTHACKSQFAKHPCYEILKLEAYIGAPILVDGARYGTVNFSAPDPRKRPFETCDYQIIRQFADWIGHEIARKRDHEALLNAQVHLERIASIDDLTQILNRRAFMERAHGEVQRFRRTQRQFSAVMIDIDRFKQINDRYGHAAGDKVLRRFAEVINEALRAVDIFGRVGGEEFCLLLHNTTIDEAHLVCERLRKKVMDECQFEDIAQKITCSIGLAAVVKEDIEFSTLMQRADLALYRAKTTGRNKTVVYYPELETAAQA